MKVKRNYLGRGRGPVGRGGRRSKGNRKVNMIRVHFIYTYENVIMKPIKIYENELKKKKVGFVIRPV
jgi:hypothetical protein